ncbi:MAG: hypothetical protein HKN20_03240, partial [Gemmatimonadetes bacterium]|nr:hypothetical protein [Gemmatimonadota bacterium]
MSSIRKVLFVVNPVSGEASGEERAASAAESLREGGVESVVLLTEKERPASVVVSDTDLAPFDAVVAVGGDGTLREVVGAVIEDGARLPVGFLPSGTANVSALALALPMEPSGLAALILANETGALDVAHLPDRNEYFVLMLGAGIAASVIEESPRSVKNVLGFGAYVIAAFKETLLRKRSLYRIALDDRPPISIRGSALFVVNLGRLPGRRIGIAPDAGGRDGLLDIVVIKTKTLFHSAAVFAQLL